jgi:isoquinoline 1-oxidoreductase subunit beta
MKAANDQSSKGRLVNTPRRQFLKRSAAISGGLTLGFYLPGASGARASASATAGAAVAATGASAIPGTEVNAWVVVRPDNTVVIRYARSEMGQGSFTAAPMMVAEELECEWQQVRVEYASANQHFRRQRVWGNLMTAGSSTIRTSQETLRKAGASAREMLVAAAAARWSVAPSECVAALGLITHTASGRKLTFGQVANAAGKLQPPKAVALKDPKEWKLIGKSIARFDIPDIVRGRPIFGIDVQLPGMRYAAVIQSPVFGGKVKSLDASNLQGRRGFIKVVPIENGVAIIADNWWRAKEMTRQMVGDRAIEWDDGANGQVTSASIVEYLRAGFDLPTVPIARKSGDVDGAFKSAAAMIEAEYYTPFLAHATLEPQVCTALLKNGRLDVWPSSQDVGGDLEQAAATAGIPQENVEVHRVQAGGGFGRRAVSIDYLRQAVEIAKAMEGTPVKMLWTREEDTQHDYYRPVALYRMRAALAANGNPIGWTTRIAMPSIYATLMKLPLPGGIDRASVGSFSDFPYAIPNQRMEYAQRDTHVRVGFVRGVAHSQNPFARECFLDELAHAAGKDPYEFRRTLLASEAKPLGVLDAAAKAADWGMPLPPGVFRGIAVTEPYGSFAAAVIEVSVSDAGELKIHRIVSALDCGYIVNPDTVIAQTQGNAVFGLTSALYGEITIEDGRVEQSNFHDYALLRMAEMPTIEVVLAPSGGFWGGVGEPGLAPIAPALCNAIFAATGKRIRALPVKNHDLKKT